MQMETRFDQASREPEYRQKCVVDLDWHRVAMTHGQEGVVKEDDAFEAAAVAEAVRRDGNWAKGWLYR